MIRATTRLLSGALALAFLVGCGNKESEMSDTAADELQLRVAEIRELANARRSDQVATKVAELHAAVADLQGRGDLSDRRALEVLAAADDVSAQLGLITTTTASTTTQPPPPPPQEDRGSNKDGDKHEDDDD